MKNTRARSSRNASCFCMLLLLLSIVIGGDDFVRPCAAKCHFEDGNFSHTCGDIMLVPDNLVSLQADCFATGNPDAEIYRSTLGLNMNIENNNGQLQCRVCMASPLVPRHCNFSHSCRNLRLEGAILYATCADRNGKPVETSLDLDRCVVNGQGYLDFVCGFLSPYA
ncbi:hypothetical protein KP509_09G026500 [Ceratopteris richardii]|uniref:Cyanovirin-N domain-containing protein n=1 Tax=Ceratopteris richardii TaxID=49495 RepID=A0A8T2U2V7_CERRI|nr:hypothetical protein KP509_09G026500 [Ceratopteris richardii]